MSRMIRAAFPCSVCNEALEVILADKPEIANPETCSVAIFEHSGDRVCAKCNTLVRPVLAAIQGAVFVMLPVPPEARKNVLVMPGGVQ